MKGKKVYVVTCNTGVIGLYEDRNDAISCMSEADYWGEYKGIKLQEMTIK